MSNDTTKAATPALALAQGSARYVTEYDPAGGPHWITRVENGPYVAYHYTREAADQLTDVLNERTWTKEKPKTEGWYWVKDPHNGRAMCLVTDIGCPGGPYIRAFYRGEVEFRRVYDALIGDWQFAGPILEPNTKVSRGA